METTVVTHDNLFHLDDLFACGVLGVLFDNRNEKYKIVRTREKVVIEDGDYVVDVGDIFDSERNRFDHHQKGGAGIRQNGVPFASAGLVWDKYGNEISGSEELKKILDKKLFQVIDADDNGLEYYKDLLDGVETLTIHDFFYTFRPTWKEDPKNFDTCFLKLIPTVKEFILRKIQVEKDKLEGLLKVEDAYNTAKDKRIVVMDKPYPGDDFLMSKPEVLYKISPNANATAWGVKAIRDSKESYKNRKDLPREWAGLRDKEMQEVTGVSDAIFCHNALFLATASSKEGALELARLAVEY